MPDDATMKSERPPNRRRFRFGLRTLFIVMTSLCLWLGYKVALERRANEILARHEAVLAALVKKSAPGRSATFHASPRFDDELLDRLGPDRFRRATAVRVDHSDSTTSQIDVSALLASNTSPTTIADQLVQHYGSALVPIGLQQTLTHGGSRNDIDSESGTCRGIWSSPNSHITVVIDAEVFVQSKSATVSILLVDSQQLHLW